ncbi:hypothetical protein BC828DRAFT_45458 [Blastocladiella britannica]|nr:hypothetical protein BC828DRAFT_45458 [Blastocladiella britannica]
MSPLYATEHGMNGAAALAAMEAGHSAAPSLFQSPRFGPGMADVTEATGDASAVLPPPPSVWSPWNLVWALLVGIPLALATIVTAFLVLVSTLGFGYPITHRLFHVARFWVWPFGCNLVKLRRIPPSPLLSPSFAIHRAWVLVFLGPIYLAAAALAWVSVLFVPMAKAVQRVLVELWRDPLGIMVGGRGMVPVTVDRGAPLTTVANDAHGATATTPLLVSSPPSAMMYGTEPPSSMADEYDPSLILLNISRAGGFAYLRATWHGTNVIFINLILFVVWVIIDGYLLHGSRHHPLLLFATCLAATIPLAYFIGNAVASISAQSSPAIGAVLNATFGSIIEVILYCLALREGKRELVEGAVIGTWLGVLLLLPGVSMIAGGMRFEQLKFNAKSAGVSNTMLIAALVGGFAPTLFYQIFGSFDLECRECHGARCSGCQSVAPAQGSDPVFLHAVVPLSYACAVILPIIYITGLVFSLKTHRKHIYHVPQKDDGGHHTRASSIRSVPTAAAATAAVAQGRRSARGSVRGTPRQNPRDHSQRPSIGSMPPVSMLSLPRPLHGAADRTGGASQAVTASSTLPPAYSQPGGGSAEAPHVTLGPPPQPTIPPIAVAVPTAAPTTNSNDNGHDAPEWSRATSLAVLVACTVLFALIAELLVGTTEAVLHGVPAITEKFLGVTIVALVPSLAEFVNAVAFAMQGNVALSLEIGSAYAVQVALIQVPALVAYSYLRVDGDAFALVFPTWDMQTCFLAVFLLTYVYIEGTANYFKVYMCMLLFVNVEGDLTNMF